MISAMFMVASCGSKSNSGEATAEGVPSEETATPQYLPADPPFTYKKYQKEGYENVPLDGVFEIQKVALAKIKGEINYSAQLSGEGDCLVVTINLKMINDYSQSPNTIDGDIQLLTKDEAVLDHYPIYWFSGNRDLLSLDKGGLGIITYTTHKELDVDNILANTKYVRITGFSAGKKISE